MSDADNDANNNAGIRLFDTHAHLHDPALLGEIDAVLQRAREAGVERIVTVGTDLETSRAAVRLAEAQDSVYASVGMHPHDAKDWSAEASRELRTLAASESVVAIGEIGLDFYRNLSPRDTQFRAFREQLELAEELDLPVIIHSRDAHDETWDVLAPWGASCRRGAPVGVIHCFSGHDTLALAYAEMGFLISFAGPVTYPKNNELRSAAKALRKDAIVVETDCPYLSPQPHRGRRNEPAYVTETASRIAELRGAPLAVFAAQTTANAARLFRV